MVLYYVGNKLLLKEGLGFQPYPGGHMGDQGRILKGKLMEISLVFFLKINSLLKCRLAGIFMHCALGLDSFL